MIIDVAETKDALEDLEVEYITKIFGYDLAKSNKWYNITSGRQRGGETLGWVLHQMIENCV